MAYFIKTGFWDKARRAPKEWLNLNQIFSDISTSETNTLTDASTIDISGNKSVLSTNAATRTFTISNTGDDMTLEVTLNTTDSVFTFPLNSLCVIGGEASGDNTLTLSGTSGDKYIIGIKKINSTYYVAAVNFGQ